MQQLGRMSEVDLETVFEEKVKQQLESYKAENENGSQGGLTSDVDNLGNRLTASVNTKLNDFAKLHADEEEFYDCRTLKMNIFKEQQELDNRGLQLTKSWMGWFVAGFVGTNIVSALSETKIACQKFGILLEMLFVTYVLFFGCVILVGASMIYDTHCKIEKLAERDTVVVDDLEKLKDRLPLTSPLKQRVTTFLAAHPSYDVGAFGRTYVRCCIIILVCGGIAIALGVQQLFAEYYFICPATATPPAPAPSSAT